jgi:adenosylcobyric acid synthase
LVVLPGSKATVDDLAWLRRTGIAEALTRRAAAGGPILGICGGYQMLGRRIVDTVESGAGEVAGLGLLDMDIEFGRQKVLRRTTAAGARDAGETTAAGYEIHHGRVRRTAEQPWLYVTGWAEAAGGAGPVTGERVPEGGVGGAVWGTHLHGLLESDEFRRGWLTEVARCAGRTGFTVAPGTRVAAVRAAQLDLLADLVSAHLDIAGLDRLLAEGVPAGLPSVGSTLEALSGAG